MVKRHTDVFRRTDGKIERLNAPSKTLLELAENIEQHLRRDYAMRLQADMKEETPSFLDKGTIGSLDAEAISNTLNVIVRRPDKLFYVTIEYPSDTAVRYFKGDFKHSFNADFSERINKEVRKRVKGCEIDKDESKARYGVRGLEPFVNALNKALLPENIIPTDKSPSR